MGIESDLSNAFMGLFVSKSMVGGGASTNNSLSTFLYLLLFFLIILLIKSYIVKVAYNGVMPTLIYSVSNKKYEEVIEEFNGISYVEALLLVILCNMLFTK